MKSGGGAGRNSAHGLGPWGRGFKSHPPDMEESIGMKLIENKISLEELKEIAKNTFGNLVKAVVDVEKEVMVVGGELHSDEEEVLLKRDSKQENLWGINLYPFEDKDWIEFDSLINLRPSLGNFTRGVDSPQIKEKIEKIVNKLIER